MASIGSIFAEQQRRAAMDAELVARDAVIERLRLGIEAVRIVATEALVDAYREIAEARLEILRLRAKLADTTQPNEELGGEVAVADLLTSTGAGSALREGAAFEERRTQ